MNNKLLVGLTIFIFSMFMARGASAALTLGSTALSSSGALTITGSGSSVWDIGNNTLSLQTTSNGPITTGTGLMTIGGNATVAGSLGLANGGGAIILGDTSGNSRGLYSIDIQTIRDDGTQIASNTYAVAVGIRNTSTGIYGTSLGNLNIASGTYSTAVGYSNHSNSNYSSSLGYSNSSTNNYTLALGYSNSATASGSISIGNNISNSTADSLMIGPSDTAKITILSTGYLGVNNSSPQSDIQVGTTASTSNQYLQIDSENGAPSAGDCNSNSQKGRMIHDYTNFKVYICGGASRGWDHLDLAD